MRASFQARRFPVIPEPPSCICLYASRARELTASLPNMGLAQKVWMPCVGGRTGRGVPGQVQWLLLEGDGEDGEREECAHLCPPPSPAGQPEGRPPPRAREGGQMVVLSLASGRPAPHNDPFIMLREPWARVSSDKGGRRAPVPLLGSWGGAEPYLSRTQGPATWRPQEPAEALLSAPGGARPCEVRGCPQVAWNSLFWVPQS